MAETIKIEIPISVQDKTNSGLTNVQKRLTNLEKSMNKVNKVMNGSGSGKSKLEQSLERASKTAEGMSESKIEITAVDNASSVMSAVSDEAARLGGAEATVDIGASDSATEQIGSVEDSAAALDGNTADVELAADDNATGIIGEVDDHLAALDGNDATVGIGADDAATGVINEAADQLASLDGTEATVVINAVSNVSDTATQAVSNGANTVAGGVATAAAGAGLTLGIGSAVNSFETFESGMSTVKAISGATEEEFAQLTAKAKEMGATTKFTATQSAEAMKYMGMAGWQAGQMVDGIEGIMNLAAASGEDLGTTSDIVTDALTAFGLSANQAEPFADILAQTAASANTNVSMLGESFKYAAPLMGAMGYTAEDTATYLGLMANAGVKGSMAGTTLRTAISNLAAPTEAMQTAMEKYGISLTDQEGNMKSLSGVMENVRDALGGLSEDEQAAAVKTIFGKQAMSGMLAIINAEEDAYVGLAEAIKNADEVNAASTMAATMLDNLEGTKTLMQSAVEGMQNTVGERMSPYLRGIMQAVTDSMPGMTDMVNEVFDTIDGKVGTIQTKIQGMLNSEEWQNGNMIDKINIAWDTLIADPFLDWAKNEAPSIIGNGVKDLFQDAFKILPGGEEAGLTSWLSAGVIAIGATKIAELASGVGTLATNLSGMGNAGTIFGTFTSGLGTALPIILGAAGAVAALAIAIDTYNSKTINDSLEKHFGNITLTEEQAAEVANQVLEADWTVDINLALGELRNADQLRSQAEESLNSNKSLEYKASVGITLTPDDMATYRTNVEDFVSNCEKELEARTFSANLLLETVNLNTPEGQSLSDMIDKWAVEDTIELNNLSSDLTNAIDTALSDGVLGVDEAQHIAELESKISSIMNKWKEAQTQAEMDMIIDQNGGLTGENLTAGSFKSVIEQLQTQRQTNSEALDAATREFYTLLHAADNAGRLEAAGLDFDTLKGQWQRAIAGENAKETSNSVGFEVNTLNGTYGDLLSGNRSDNADAAANAVDFINSEFQSGVDSGSLLNAIDTQASTMLTYSGWLASSDQKAIARLYKKMKPDVSAMADFISGAFDSEGNQLYKIPQEVMDQYNEAIEIGAASGDKDAAWQLFANQMAESGDAALLQGIQDGTVAVPEELRAALQRTLAEVGDEDIDLEGLTAKVSECEVSEDSVDVVQQSIDNFVETLSDSGSAVEVTAEGVTVQLGEVEVDEPSAAEQVAEALGMTMEELAEATGVSEVELTAGATVTIPAENITTDSSALQSAVESAVESGDVAKIETTAESNTTVENSSTDASAAYQSAIEDTQGEFDQEMPIDGEADITLAQSNNASAIYTEASADVQSAFNASIPVSASAVITIDYQIANPTKTFSVSGSGSGSLTVSASAMGRFVDNPMLSLIGEDGPEYVIPVGADKRGRGLDLWMQAGKDLGVSAYADGGLVGYTSGDGEEAIDLQKTPVSENTSGNSSAPAVNVNFSNTINVDGATDPDEIVRVIKANLKDLSDDMAGQIAVMLAESYENRPCA